MDPEAGPTEAFSSNKSPPGWLGDNIKVKCATIAGVLNLMGEKGRLIRRRKGKQKVLRSRAEDGNRKRIKSEETTPKIDSRF